MKYFFLIVIAVLLISCDSLFNGGGDRSIRDFSWRVDTVWTEGAGQVYMDRVWGSSARDIYMVGHSSGHNTIYHYDGIKWETPKYHVLDGGELVGSYDLFDIYGFGPDDVWAVGLGGSYGEDYHEVIHFDGTSWQDVPFAETPYDDQGLISVWGIGPNDMWFSSWRGDIYHWDGMVIKKDSMIFEYEGSLSPIYRSYVGGDALGNVYYVAVTDGNPNPQSKDALLFQRFGDHWKYISRTNNFGLSYLTQLVTGPDGLLYAYAGGLAKLVDNQWEMLFNGDANSFWGATLTNMLVCNGNGKAYHYDGKSWDELTKIHHPEVIYRLCWTDGNEAIVAGWIDYRTVVFHGK